jgi:hypothetical protein
MSSDGGLLLLKAADKVLGLTHAVAETIIDRRQPEKVRHEILELVRQRVFSLAAGYPDCNDADYLRQDPVLKLMCDRDPITGDDLGSQPTLSRLENSVTRAQLLNMSTRLAESILRRQAKRRRGSRRPKRITIDLDPTCVPVYGHQQLSLFNGYYDERCYLPSLVTVSFNAERRKYPIAALLRPGTAKWMNGTLFVLKRAVACIRRFFPHTSIFFRADAEFCTPEILDYLEETDIYYAIPIASNTTLKIISLEWMAMVRCVTRIHGKSVSIPREDTYQAGTWSRPRRLIYKAEVVVRDGEYRDNDRYLVTNFPRTYGPAGVFAFYHKHAVMENTIKDLKNALELDRTSCSSFFANQLRLIWSLAAFTLMHSLQEHISDRELAVATMHTVRERLLKIAVVVRESSRRIVFNFTSHYPWAGIWLRGAISLGAASG